MKNLAIIALATSLLISCGSKDEKDSAVEKEKEKAGLDGTWEIKRATGSMADMQIGVTYTFDGDKLTFGTSGYQNPGKTEVTDKTFSFTAEGTDLKFMYDYSMNGDTLVVHMQDSDQTFYLLKK